MTVTTPPDNPEFVAPNANYGRYFMANDARMYIGNVFIDELDSVQFVLQDNKILVYPYMGRFFAAIGQGRSLVQGQIAINFISEGYLYAVLDNYQAAATPANPQQDELNQLVAAQSNPGQTVLGASTPTSSAVQTRIKALAASLGAAGLDTAHSYSKKVQLGSVETTANFPNAVYQGGPFDIELDFTAGGRTVSRRLENCFLGTLLRPKPKNLTHGREPPSPSGSKSRASGLSAGWAKGRR